MTSKSFQAQLDDPSTPHNETMKIYTISTNALCQRKAALSCRVRSFSLALKFLQAVQKWLQVPNGMRWTACLLLSTGPWPQSREDRFTEFSVDSSKDRLQHILKLAKDKRRDWGGKTEEIQSVVWFMSWQTNTHLTGRAAGSLGSNLLEALNCLFLRSFQKHPKCSCYFFLALPIHLVSLSQTACSARVLKAGFVSRDGCAFRLSCHLEQFHFITLCHHHCRAIV